MLRVQILIVGQLQTNCYILTEGKFGKAFIIDPGDDASYIADTIASKKLTPVGILATHGHFDHVLSAFELQHMFSIPFYIHAKDEFLLLGMQKSAEYYLKIPIVDPPPIPSKEFQKNMFFEFGLSEFEILETPGHTPGGVCFYFQKDHLCFTGDTVFAGGAIGDWRHSYSDKQALLSSVQKILSLPKETILYPGHGEQTTVADLHI